MRKVPSGVHLGGQTIGGAFAVAKCCLGDAPGHIKSHADPPGVFAGELDVGRASERKEPWFVRTCQTRQGKYHSLGFKLGVSAVSSRSGKSSS